MNLTKPVESWWTYPGFRLEHIATGLDKPVNIAPVPRPGRRPSDPLLYVTELYGQVKVITNDCQVLTYAENLLNYTPDYIFPGSGESGVIGLCIEPESGDLFISMLYKDGNDYKAKVARTKSVDGLTMGSMETVISGIPSVLGAHQIHAVTIGLDRKLYVNVGDGIVTPSPAQDEKDLRGKVLRIELDGSIPKDNPDPNSPVFAKGFRSPFGATWRNSDRSLYISDNGPDTYDRIARVEAGGNYGWPVDMRQNSMFWWTFTQVPTALAFMQDDRFSSDFTDHLFVALAGPARYRAPSMKGKSIVKLELSEDGKGVRSYDEFVVYHGEGMAMPVGLAFGTDSMYFTDLHGEGGIRGKEPEGNIFAVKPE